MDKKLLSKAYKAGCRGLIFGLESASQNVLNHIKKNVIISTVEDVIINCYDVVIYVCCFFIIGYVNETEKDFENILQFVKKITNILKQYILERLTYSKRFGVIRRGRKISNYFT